MTTGTLAESALNPAMNKAVEHLMNVQTENGLFVYDFDFLAEAPSGEANLVRQAGTGYGLSEYYMATRDPRVAWPLRRLLTALTARSQPVGGTGRRGSVVTQAPAYREARTGTTALALLTELFYHHVSGDQTFSRERRRWLEALIALRNDGGGFRKSPGDRAESPYFNGETWLALAQYNTHFMKAGLDEFLRSVDAALIDIYGNRPDVSFFHWGIMAAAARHRATSDGKLSDFIIEQTRVFLDEMKPAFSKTTNSGYALEGLLTAYPVVKTRDPELAEHLWARIEREMEKILAFQFNELTEIKKAPKASALRQHTFSRYLGCFFARSDRKYTRIDYTQHCLSAIVKMSELKREQTPRLQARFVVGK